jgi:hypothetical protein
MWVISVHNLQKATQSKKATQKAKIRLIWSPCLGHFNVPAFLTLAVWRSGRKY